MSEQRGKVKFVRIRGRIVPIRQKISEVSESLSAAGAATYIAAEAAHKVVAQRHSEILAQKKTGLFTVGKHARGKILKKLARSRTLMRVASRTSRIGALVATMAFVSHHIFADKE